jgi:hypothetical protein
MKALKNPGAQKIDRGSSWKYLQPHQVINADLRKDTHWQDHYPRC